MSTLIVGREPVVEAWLEQRRTLGQDRRDEVWEGVLHVAPYEHTRNGVVAMQLVALFTARARAAGLVAGGSFNLGDARDFRIPDLGWHRGAPSTHAVSAAVVVEVLSPDDETWQKFGFYAAHGVEELWVVDPLERTARVWALADGAYDERGTSPLLGLSTADVVAGVDWP